MELALPVPPSRRPCRILMRLGLPIPLALHNVLCSFLKSRMFCSVHEEGIHLNKGGEDKHRLVVNFHKSNGLKWTSPHHLTLYQNKKRNIASRSHYLMEEGEKEIARENPTWFWFLF